MADLETLKAVAEKSKDLLASQIASYREKRSIVSTIIGLDTLFIPFYLSGMQDAYWWIKLLSAVPVILICVSIHYFIKIYHVISLEHGFNVKEYDDLVTQNHENFLLLEISTNRKSFKDNEERLEKIVTSYDRGVRCTVFAIGISVIILSLNLICSPPKEPTKVEITNFKEMSNNNSNNTNSGNGNSNNTQSNPTVVIPAPRDTQPIKEGVDKPVKK